MRSRNTCDDAVLQFTSLFRRSADGFAILYGKLASGGLAIAAGIIATLLISLLAEGQEASAGWDYATATPGTSLTLKETDRSRNEQGNVVTYRLLAKGFQKDE